MREASPRNEGVFAGLRVIDASTLLAAPLICGLLADFGAEVIKVEMPRVGDPVRHMTSQVGVEAAIHKVTNRNKYATTIDLHSERGRELFYQLVSKSDAVVTNFQRDTLRKWKIDYDDLKKRKADLVFLHLSAFGREGPWSERPGFARVAEGFAGLMDRTGDPDGPPMPSGYPIVDAMAGLMGAYGVVTALYRRRQTGEGELVDLSLYDALLRTMEDQVVEFALTGKIPKRSGTCNPSVAPNDLYRARDGQYVIIPASTDTMFRRLCAAIGKPQLAEDPRFATNATRVANRGVLDAELARQFEQFSADDLMAVLLNAQVVVGRVNNVQDMLEDPHCRQRGDFITVPDGDLGTIEMQGVVPRLLNAPGSVAWAGRDLGADNEYIFGKLCEIGKPELDRLANDGII